MTARTGSRLAAAGLAATLLLGGCAGPGHHADGEAGGHGAASDAPDDSFAAGAMQDPAAPETADGAESSEPVRISIPSIDVDAGFEHLGIGSDGRLDAPVDYDLAGWYADGVEPGDVGPAIVAGHVDSRTAPAVFVRLAELDPGAEVVVEMSDGDLLTFETTRSTQSAKSAFPTADVYSNVPAPELRLVTCAGDFDSGSGHYVDNLVVFAELRDRTTS
ncbi:class F sortase [Promicromonospora sp. NPDC057488]|uniref:class F sortase n=1 Tax=Promicromonospora sp. NPDC057488 TaxID=3346147 RepID=UPI003670A6B6